MSTSLDGMPAHDLDCGGILLPIGPDRPCGEDLSFSVEFDRIQEARRADDPTLDQGEWIAPLKQADWHYVANQCSDILKRRSKDIRLLVWLGESLGKLRGFEGLAEAHYLIAKAMDNYWEAMYPLPEEGDQELRIGNLGWFLLRTAQLLREIPITNSDHGHYSTADFEAARTLQSAMDRDAENAEALSLGKTTLAMFDKAQKATPSAFYAQLSTQITHFEQHWLALQAAVDRRLGSEGPSFRGVEESLDAVRSILGRFDRGSADESPVGAAAPLNGPRTTNQARALDGEIRDREQALRALSEVAAFFRRTEPHSPVAYLADKAAAWGAMPLHVWLRAVMKDANALSHIEEILGTSDAREGDLLE